MKISTDMVRKAIRALGDGGREVSYRQVYEALGLSSEAEQAVVRSRAADMKRHGEIQPVRPGVCTYDEQRRPRGGRMHTIIWRFVRTTKAGWSISDCALMTRVSYTHILRYVAWLEGEGFLERTGRNSRRAVLFRATGKAHASPRGRSLPEGAGSSGDNYTPDAVRRPLRAAYSPGHREFSQNSFGQV